MISPRVGQVLDMPGTTNFRSTAGYSVTGGELRDGGLFRSDALHRLDEQGLGRLRELGVVRVLDLRDAVELGLEPSALIGSNIEVVHHPIFGEGGLLGIGSFAIDAVYRFVIEQRATNLAGAIRLIAEAPEGGVVVHCTAGKDRTGLVIATALSAVGVPREQIVADYAVSEANIAGARAERILAAARMRFGELDDEAIELMIGSPERAISRALDLIDQRYGGAAGMLIESGLDTSTLDALHDRLIA